MFANFCPGDGSKLGVTYSEIEKAKNLWKMAGFYAVTDAANETNSNALFEYTAGLFFKLKDLLPKVATRGFVSK